MIEQTLRVTSIRSQSPKGFGGCIFTGKPVDDQGNVQDAAAYYVVKATGLTLGKALVQTGQWWKVSGDASERSLAKEATQGLVRLPLCCKSSMGTPQSWSDYKTRTPPLLRSCAKPRQHTPKNKGELCMLAIFLCFSQSV